MLLAPTGQLEWLEQQELLLSLEADVGCWPGPISIPHCPWLGPTSGTDSQLDLTLERNLSQGLVSVRAYIQVGLAKKSPW